MYIYIYIYIYTHTYIHIYIAKLERQTDSYDTQEITSLLWAAKDWIALKATVTPPVPEYELSQIFFPTDPDNDRSQWPRGLRHKSAAARLLRSCVRIPPGAWMFVCCECCVLSGRGLCDKLITRPEESYRLWYVVVCDLETSTMRRPWPALGRSATAQKKKIRTMTGSPAEETGLQLDQNCPDYRHITVFKGREEWHSQILICHIITAEEFYISRRRQGSWDLKHNNNSQLLCNCQLCLHKDEQTTYKKMLTQIHAICPVFLSRGRGESGGRRWTNHSLSQQDCWHCSIFQN
jgi:hypothetical protein